MSRIDPPTREILHLIAAHVMGRRRFEAVGRFGLRALPGGFGTPAFGEPIEVVRISGTALVHEVGAEASHVPIEGSTLRELANRVGTDLGREFSAGDDTPALHSPDAPVTLDPESVESIARWFDLGWQAMDRLSKEIPDDGDCATIQLWPEHFDAATNVVLRNGDRMNVGVSPGDSFEAEPYAYVGPWSSERLGDPEFWNAPFGAFLRSSEILGEPDPVSSCTQFFTAGLENATGGRRR